jgi:hypothetical protein
MSQVVDRWATAILYHAVSYADHGPNTIGESAGAAIRFEVNNSPSVASTEGAHISSSSRIAGRGRLLTVTIVAMLSSLTTPYDLVRSPL